MAFETFFQIEIDHLHCFKKPPQVLRSWPLLEINELRSEGVGKGLYFIIRVLYKSTLNLKQLLLYFPPNVS